jgi:hypothetical protein
MWNKLFINWELIDGNAICVVIMDAGSIDADKCEACQN